MAIFINFSKVQIKNENRKNKIMKIVVFSQGITLNKIIYFISIKVNNASLWSYLQIAEKVRWELIRKNKKKIFIAKFLFNLQISLSVF